MRTTIMAEFKGCKCDVYLVFSLSSLCGAENVLEVGCSRITRARKRIKGEEKGAKGMKEGFRTIPTRMGRWMSEHGDLHPFWQKGVKQNHRTQAKVTDQPHYGKYSKETETTPCCDVCETKEAYYLYFDLPGVKKEDFEIEMDDNRITVAGQRRRDPRASQNAKEWYSEVDYGEFQRSMTLPEDIDLSDVEAVYDEGVLSVRLPKIQSPRRRTIAIQP